MKEIKNYEGLYSITEDGLVFSHRRNTHMKNQKNKLGYLNICLIKSNKVRKFSIHRLVGAAYVYNEENKPEINHIDGNKENNHYSNLEWVTKSENLQHKFQVLGHTTHLKGKFGENHPAFGGNRDYIRNLVGKKIIQYDFKMNIINKFKSVGEAGKHTKVERSNISACCNNRVKSAGGFIWRFEK